MTQKVPDFKNSNGEWVYRYTSSDGTRYFTRAGMLYHALKQRVNPSGTKQKASPLYAGCENMFEDFQDFAEWCQTQIGYDRDFHLDKDLLVKGNKIYSKEFCVFLPKELNTVLTKRTRGRGKYPIGVSEDKHGIKARCSKLGEKDSVFLGYFDSAEDAFFMYRKYKESWLKELAVKWKDQIDPRAYEALMNYRVEITD